MRNKLALALILFGAVAVTTASMPQNAAASSQRRDLPYCTCMQSEELSSRYGVLDPVTGKCDLTVECLIP